MTRSLRAAGVLAAAILIGSAGSAVAQAQSPCVDFGGSLNGNICRVHATTDAYTVDIAFPTDHPDPGPMMDYLRQTRDGFVNVAQTPRSTGLPYALDITSEQYRSGIAPGGTRSVVLKIYQNVGGAHPTTWYKAFNYNLDSRKAITFDDLFKPNSNPLSIIFPIVQRDLERQIGQPISIAPGDAMDASHYQNFAITDAELIFFFSQSELLPSAAGANVAHVPRNAVAQILA